MVKRFIIGIAIGLTVAVFVPPAAAAGLTVLPAATKLSPPFLVAPPIFVPTSTTALSLNEISLPLATNTIPAILPEGTNKKSKIARFQIYPGQLSYPQAKDLGLPLPSEHQALPAVESKAISLEQVLIYPNPYHRREEGKYDDRNKICFDKLSGKTVRIYTISGELVEEFGNEKGYWDLNGIASGTYLAVITDSGGNKRVQRIGVIK